MRLSSLPKHMLREIAQSEGQRKSNLFTPYLEIPKSGKKELKSAFTAITNQNQNFSDLKEEAKKIIKNLNEEDIILNLFNSNIKLKHLRLFEDENILHENMLSFLSNFLIEKQIKQNKKIFKSQIVLIRISNESNTFEYKYFQNKEKNIPLNYEEYNNFIYIIKINNHAALAILEIHSLKCSLYVLCKDCQENLFQVLPKFHKNFLNVEINEYIFQDFFSKMHDEDDNSMNCSLILNYILISLYSHGVVDKSVIDSTLLNTYKEKTLKIFYGILKKTHSSPPIYENKLKIPTDQTGIRKSLVPSALQKITQKNENNIPVSSLSLKKTKSSTLDLKNQIPFGSALKKKSKFFNKNSIFLPGLKTNSTKTIPSDQSSFFKKENKNKKIDIILTKNDIIPIVQNMKKQLVDEIIQKINSKKEKSASFQNNDSRLENFNNFQNYLYFYYYNNPELYGKLVNEYNKRYYSYLMKSFGATDDKYLNSVI